MKKVLSLVIVLALFCTLLCTPQAAAIVADPAPDTSTPSDEYAVVIKAKDRSSWQLTTEELNAPTEELVKSILASPYILALSCSNTPDIDPYAVLSMYFNGLRELESREDASSVMLSLLEELTSSPKEPGSLDRSHLRTLLSESYYYKRLTDSEKETYRQLRDECDNHVDVQVSNLISSVDFVANDFTYVYTNVGGYTADGEYITIHTPTTDYSDEEKQLRAEATAAAFGITLLGEATSRYNCHSYAWHNPSTSSLSWIVDVETYLENNHCTRTNYPSVGSIVVYYGSNGRAVHSAVVSGINGDTVMCISKWGANGLFEHQVNNVPSVYYNGDTLEYYYYDYAQYHSCTFVINNSATHTRTCTLCGWSQTESHVANPKTGNCIGCGLKGPFSYARG